LLLLLALSISLLAAAAADRGERKRNRLVKGATLLPLMLLLSLLGLLVSCIIFG
jgi:hypothetical protein